MKTKKLIAIFVLMFLLCFSLTAISACGFVNSGSSGSGSSGGSSSGDSSDSSSSDSSGSGSSSGDATEDCSLGHSYSDWVIDTDATCTETGKKHKTCLRCGYIQTEIIGALGHNYENGECTRCGDIELQPTANEYFSFEKNDEGYTIYVNENRDKELPAEILIPSVYNGKPVTSIGDWAFYNCDGLTSIVIPSSVTEIGNGVFDGCNGLTSITIPDSITSIGGTRAFDELNNLKYNEYDNGLYLGNESNPYVVLIKENNKDVTTCVINENTKIIYDEAFSRCGGLTSIVIGSGVTSIGGYAFCGCDGLTSVNIPNNVTSIGNFAFSGCRGLTSVYYKGNEAEWTKISIGDSNEELKTATIYYYSETKPSEEGNYWHYDSNGSIAEW